MRALDGISLNVAEAARFSGLSQASIRAAINRDEIAVRRGPYRDVSISAIDVLYLALLKRAAISLSGRSKQEVRRWVRSRDWEHDGAHVAITPAVRLVWPDELMTRRDQLAWYGTTRDRLVHRDPAIKGGEPVVRGTRIGVYTIAGRLGRGDSVDALLEDFPQLSRDAIEVASEYATANPRRGRPRHAS